jgi:hypothetical protein
MTIHSMVKQWQVMSCRFSGRIGTSLAVNHAALNRNRAAANINPLEAPCASHGNSSAGKKTECPVAHLVAKHMTKMVQHGTCKARTIFKLAFDQRPLKGGGASWNQHFGACDDDAALSDILFSAAF